MSSLRIEIELSDGTTFSYQPRDIVANFNKAEDADRVLAAFDDGVEEMRAQLLGYIERASSRPAGTDRRNRPKLPPA